MSTRSGGENAARRIALASLMSRRDGFLETRVEGRSMGDTLPVGSMVRLKPVEKHRPDPGEVVAVAVGGRIVIHRVLSVREGGEGGGWALIRGDADLLPDPPVTLDAIVGRAIEVHAGEQWSPLPPPRRRALPARAAAGCVGAVLGGVLPLSVPLADRLTRLMLLASYLGRFVLSGGRSGRLVWPYGK